MAYANSDRRRWSGALAALAVQGGLALLVFYGLSTRWDGEADVREPALVSFDQSSPPPDPPPSPAQREPEPAGAPAAANPDAAPREAPPAKVVIAEPSPAASRAGAGTASDAGKAGPGGTGTGTGGSGSGAGGGGAVSPPVRISGAISDRDYPRAAAAHGAAGTTAISFRVRRDGRVDNCSVLGSSGDAGLDALTCTLVERRFVYRPALGTGGEPRETTLRTTFTWGTRSR